MDFARIILLLYCLIGFLVAGGLLFKREKEGHFWLGVFVLVFALEVLDFLYLGSEVLLTEFGAFYMLLFPICLLYGPALWLHLLLLLGSNLVGIKRVMLHMMPFFFYVAITIFLLTIEPSERRLYVRTHFDQMFLPLAICKALHVSLYGFLIWRLLRRTAAKQPYEKRLYAKAITGIYLISAVFLTYFSLFSYSYRSFLIYFLVASSAILLVGFVLYYYPEALQKIRRKYRDSGLTRADKTRIITKIKSFVANPQNVIDPNLKLASFCQAIEEQKHHVSQTLSEEFEASYSDLVNRRRIELSMKMLKDPSYDHLKILAIALECGFTNKNTFHRAFVKFQGCSPSAYRKKGVTDN